MTINLMPWLTSNSPCTRLWLTARKQQGGEPKTGSRLCLSLHKNKLRVRTNCAMIGLSFTILNGTEPDAVAL